MINIGERIKFAFVSQQKNSYKLHITHILYAVPDFGDFNTQKKVKEMAKVEASIRGIKPLIFHKFNIEALTDTRKPKEGSTGNNFNEWKSSFFHDNGHLYLPGNYLFAAFKNGAVNSKVGRGTIQKTWISAVNIIEEKVFMNRHVWDNWQETDLENLPIDSSRDVYVDIRMVSNPNTKGKNVRYRLALSPGWACSFSLDIDESLISSSQVRKVIEDTGKLQGIADGRTLGYGRFELDEYNFKK